MNSDRFCSKIFENLQILKALSVSLQYISFVWCDEFVVYPIFPLRTLQNRHMKKNLLQLNGQMTLSTAFFSRSNLWISVCSFWLRGSIVANPIIYRLVPSPSRFETRQWRSAGARHEYILSNPPGGSTAVLNVLEKITKHYCTLLLHFQHFQTMH